MAPCPPPSVHLLPTVLAHQTILVYNLILPNATPGICKLVERAIAHSGANLGEERVRRLCHSLTLLAADAYDEAAWDVINSITDEDTGMDRAELMNFRSLYGAITEDEWARQQRRAEGRESDDDDDE